MTRVPPYPTGIATSPGPAEWDRRDRTKPGGSDLPARKAEAPEQRSEGPAEWDGRDRTKPGGSDLPARKAEAREQRSEGPAEWDDRARARGGAWRRCGA